MAELHKIEKKKAKDAGSFQQMNLIKPVLKGVLKMGYRVPTPIQRKAIPMALMKCDVVAMARTGSGKTAAFLIPMLHHLKEHKKTMGARGLIISPTRELVLQTHRFAKKMAKQMNIRIAVVVGGESLQKQFDAMTMNPDLIIATPGRLMHLLSETNMSLRSITMICYDEADRLFEVGFAVQIREIQKKLAPERQTLLFSATMPKQLAEFTTAHLKDPQVLRLDSETKISEKLESQFLLCRAEAKRGVLLYLLQQKIPKSQQAILFCPTRHHAEHLSELLDTISIQNVLVFGSMEQVCRNANVGKFRQKKARVMVVTDLAARGIDIPLLDNVINFNIPTKVKTFVHRVGRVARAGNRGFAWNIVDPADRPYMCDLFRFLGTPLRNKVDEDKKFSSSDTYYGAIPRSFLEHNIQHVDKLQSIHFNLQTSFRLAENGEKAFRKCSSDASKLGCWQAKQIDDETIHPMFSDEYSKEEQECDDMISTLKNFRPPETIFEFSGKKTNAYLAMKETRRVAAKKRKADELVAGELGTTEKPKEPPRKKKKKNFKGKKKAKSFKDAAFFVECEPVEDLEEDEFAITDGKNQLEKLLLTVDDDELDAMVRKKRSQKWDSKKKKFVTKFMADDLKAKYAQKTESGGVSDLRLNQKRKHYKLWQKHTNKTIGGIGEEEVSGSTSDMKSLGLRKFKHIQGSKEHKLQLKIREELRNESKIRKMRKTKEKNRTRNQLAKKKNKFRQRKGKGRR